MTSNIKAFLDMIATSEGTALIPNSDNGYKVIVGSTSSKPILMASYADHPRKLIKINSTLSSTAAGRYQVLARYYDAYKKLLELPDFSPASQDAIAIEQIKERRAIPLIVNGDIAGAIARCGNIWASLTGSTYGQHTHTLEFLTSAYVKAGGTLKGSV
jgi:muramidase (phage lysozyme)